MGNVARFDLASLVDHFDINTFVETGAGQGDSLAYAVSYFNNLFSCEIHQDLARETRKRFANEPKIRVYALNSFEFLSYICGMLPLDEPVLFWLDAHFPGADYGLAAFDADYPVDIRLPLSRELLTILRRRPPGKDVILIDDARIWLDGAFAHGNLPYSLRVVCPTSRDIRFIHEMFEMTHTIDVLYEHEGYIQLMPREEFCVRPV